MPDKKKTKSAVKVGATAVATTTAKVVLAEAAAGSREGGFDPQQSAAFLAQSYPGTDAVTMASTFVQVWAGEVSKDSLKTALQACQTYSDTQINQAVAATINLNWSDWARYEQQIYFKVLGLYQGDLTALQPAEKIDFLVVSSTPGDYTPSSGSLIGSLNQKGVSVAALSQNKAANYEPIIPCWISQEITNPQPGIAFKRILLFEPANPSQQAAAHVPDIFSALSQFVGSNPASVTVAMPLVCTGSGGANPSNIMTATFNAAKSLMLLAFPLYAVKIVIYDQNQLNTVKPVFDSLKNT